LLLDLIWATAARLGYASIFINENYPVSENDHLSFIRRGVPACDIIDFDVESTYWHTPQVTLGRVDPHSLAIRRSSFRRDTAHAREEIPLRMQRRLLSRQVLP
jgi:peptidase M28-like protein